jgi:hypothetical protein
MPGSPGSLHFKAAVLRTAAMPESDESQDCCISRLLRTLGLWYFKLLRCSDAQDRMNLMSVRSCRNPVYLIVPEFVGILSRAKHPRVLVKSAWHHCITAAGESQTDAFLEYLRSPQSSRSSPARCYPSCVVGLDGRQSNRSWTGANRTSVLVPRRLPVDYISPGRKTVNHACL